jgi:hypothetical protein
LGPCVQDVRWADPAVAEWVEMAAAVGGGAVAAAEVVAAAAAAAGGRWGSLGHP